MGIQDLVKFLRKEVPSAFRPFAGFDNQVVAVDVALFAHKFSYVDQTTQTLPQRFYNFSKGLLRDGASKIIYVFDGKATPLKEQERQKRKEAQLKQYSRKVECSPPATDLQSPIGMQPLICQVLIEDDTAPTEKIVRQPVFPQFEDYQNLQKYLRSIPQSEMPIEVKVACHEAEALVSYLVQTQQAHFAITDDSDALAFLSPKTVFHYGKDVATVILLNEVLDQLVMTPERFQQFCIFCGCDFVERLPLIGPAKIYKTHKKFASDSEFVSHLYESCTDSEKCLFHKDLYEKVFDFFKTFANERPH